MRAFQFSIALALISPAVVKAQLTPPRASVCLSRQSVTGIRAVASADRCFIEWVNALTARDLEDRNAARAGLAVMGGRPAVDVLMADYERSKEKESLHSLISAMATTGSAEDIRFLVSQLKGPLTGNSNIWPTTQAAAMTLGFLRATAARDSLSALLARNGPASLAGHSAAWALEAIDRPACADSLSGNTGRALLRIVMSCNPPSLSRRITYQDAASGGAWRFVDGGWRHQAASPGDTTLLRNRLSWATAISLDSTQALVQIGTHCGPRCGEGWTFRLRRFGNLWRVVNGQFDWVS